MKILIIEDDENKRIQLAQFLTQLIPEHEVFLERSLQSGVRKIRQDAFDLIILDMTLPQYDITPDEPADDTHIFGGRQFLTQMDRFEVETPVIVFTQFEVFGKPPNELTLESLDLQLKSLFPDIYNEAIYYHSSIDSWKASLKEKLVNFGFLKD